MTQIREEAYFTKGRVIVRGKTVRNAAKRRRPTTCSTTSRTSRSPSSKPRTTTLSRRWHAAGARVRRDSRRPLRLQLNGDAFLEHDRTATSGTVTREIPLDQFPSPDELWNRYCAAKGWTRGPADHGRHAGLLRRRLAKVARYYQLIAINRTVEAIARGENRILLVMATGTGKTYTAFQIIWRLWKSGAKKRILFLVDRNILADQTKTNDFKPFGKAMTKITNRTVDKRMRSTSASIRPSPAPRKSRTSTSSSRPDFFDLVIVDECHRGSAADDAAWRQVLEYFSSATQIGLTATPKETKDVSNIEYFGDPIYTYSLRQGIADGFLAPYKVVRIGLDKDLDGWRPEPGRRTNTAKSSRTANTTTATSTGI
jgi:type I restriction enzyme R subunit